MSILSDLTTKIPIFDFLVLGNENFGFEKPYEQFLGKFEEFWKNRYFWPPKSSKMGLRAENGKYEKIWKIDLKFVFFDLGGSNWAQKMPNAIIFQSSLQKMNISKNKKVSSILGPEWSGGGPNSYLLRSWGLKFFVGPVTFLKMRIFKKKFFCPQFGW